MNCNYECSLCQREESEDFAQRSTAKLGLPASDKSMQDHIVAPIQGHRIQGIVSRSSDTSVALKKLRRVAMEDLPFNAERERGEKKHHRKHSRRQDVIEDEQHLDDADRI